MEQQSDEDDGNSGTTPSPAPPDLNPRANPFDSPRPPPSTSVTPATTLFRWQKGVFVGAGASASVYTAYNLDTGAVMAVKEVRLRGAGSADLYERISDELAVLALLRHPNIAAFYGIEEYRDRIYIFQELCEGGSLAELLNRQGRIEDESILQVYTMQILEGLVYLHSLGIVHCDIKPENILLNHLGVIKLVDFGAAQVRQPPKHPAASRSASPSPYDSPYPHDSDPPPLTRTHSGDSSSSLAGTPMYMSPEVVRSADPGRHGARDVWALGCVVLECATGRKPWGALDNKGAILFRIGTTTTPPPLPSSSPSPSSRPLSPSRRRPPSPLTAYPFPTLAIPSSPPPLPELKSYPDIPADGESTSSLSEIGVAFLRGTLVVDAARRPTAAELLEHPWMAEFRQMLQDCDEIEEPGNAEGDPEGGVGLDGGGADLNRDVGTGEMKVDDFGMCDVVVIA